MKNILFVLVLSMLSSVATYAEIPTIEIKIKDHRFIPDVVEIPQGKKVKLVVINGGPGAEEFESNELNREKVILPGKRANIFIGPLEKGEYSFFGEFNPKTAQGKIKVN